MYSGVSDFVDKRMEEMRKDLSNSNCEYLSDAETCKNLYTIVEDILTSKGGITLSAQDCMDLGDYLEAKNSIHALFERLCYRQGYLDCVQLLSILGILPDVPRQG